jgi:peptidoglycan/LPS O-acetylase OafA/YrhL
MDSTLSPPRQPRYPGLDLWRGVACLMIVVLHASHYASENNAANPFERAVLWALSKMGAGVPIFFVISGYCIAATSDAMRRKPRAPGRFFVRRFRRIFPPYWIFALMALSLVMVLTALGRAELVSGNYGLIPHPQRVSWSQWVGNITLTQTWRYHLFGDPELKIIGPAWTLCYEEQFYAVCALILIVAPRRFFAGVTLVTLATLVTAPWSQTSEGQAIRGFFFDGRWLMFAEGVAVYYALNYARRRTPGIAFFAALLFAVIALRLRPEVATDEFARNAVWELIASTVFALAALLLRPWDGRLVGSRLTRPLAACGQMCYSLYLIHWPITIVITEYAHGAGVRGFWPTVLFAAPAAVAVSVACAWLFHIMVERRFLNAPAGRPDPPLCESDRRPRRDTPESCESTKM